MLPRSVPLLVLACLSGALAQGCFYDSRWGETKAAQKRNAAVAAPAALRNDDREGDPAAPEARNAGARMQKLRVRAFVTRSFTAQVIDAPRHLRDLFEDLNRITERDLGMHLELVETRSWDLASDDDLDGAFEALRGADRGEDIDEVAGFIGALPRATRSFHEVGKGALVGKHLVVRAPSSAERHDSIEKAFDELPEAERRDLEKRLRRHRATAVFLHELGHTLGSVHETSPQSLMFPDYNAKMTAFGTSANDVMRTALAKHGASEAVLAKEVASSLQRAPEGAFVAVEREKLVRHLDDVVRASDAHAKARTAHEPSAEPAIVVPETPELTAADRARFEEAYRASARGDVVAAWNTGRPLFSTYPRSMAVQDFRCRTATQSMRFEVARRECETLMKLSTTP